MAKATSYMRQNVVRKPDKFMKKTCNRCRALEHLSGWIDVKCHFGYPISKDSIIPKPLIECPKPLTNKEWLSCDYYKESPAITQQDVKQNN